MKIASQRLASTTVDGHHVVYWDRIYLQASGVCWLFSEWRIVVPRGRETRRWWLRADHHKAPARHIDYVRAKRLEQGLTMKELAREIGILFGSYKYWELHLSKPLPKSRRVLVRYLGCDPEQAGAASNA